MLVLDSVLQLPFEGRGNDCIDMVAGGDGFYAISRCSPRFLSFRHGAIKPFIFAQRDILHFLEGRKLKHRTSEVSSNHFVPFEEK
jgi:hypothetical protein